jgi:hypothetical protein
MGVEAHLGSDLSTGVHAALAEYTRQLGSDSPPLAIPRLARECPSAQPAKVIDLPLNEQTVELLECEAARQRTTVSALVSHSVLVYLADIDRMTPAGAA